MFAAFATSTPLSTLRRHPSSLRRCAHTCTRPSSFPKMTSSSSSSSPSTSAVNRARTAVITGGSGGIGEQTCKGLIRSLPELHHLIICCRNIPKGEAVAEPLRNGAVAGRRLAVTVLPVELLSAASVVQCAHRVNAALGPDALDLLLCNAGIMAAPLRFSANAGAGEFEAVESQFAVNHLSHALLTDRLLPALRRDNGGRVVFVSSMAVAIAKGRSTAPVVAEKTPSALNDTNYAKWKAYGDSKLANALYAKALAGKEGGVVEAVSLHPGVVQTELGRYILPDALAKGFKSSGPPGFIRGTLLPLVGFKTPEQGAELSVELSAARKGTLDNGAMYLSTGGKKAPDAMIPLLKNEAEVQNMYEDTQRFVNAF